MNEQLIGLTAAMEILPDAVLIVNREQVIIGCNRVAEALFGYRHDEPYVYDDPSLDAVA